MYNTTPALPPLPQQAAPMPAPPQMAPPPAAPAPMPAPPPPPMNQYGGQPITNPFAANPGPRPPQFAGAPPPAPVFHAPQMPGNAGPVGNANYGIISGKYTMPTAPTSDIQTRDAWANGNMPARGSVGQPRANFAQNPTVAVQPDTNFFRGLPTNTSPAQPMPISPAVNRPLALSDMRAKTNIVPAGSVDLNALDAAYARQGKDTAAPYTNWPGHDAGPSVDLRPAQGYTYEYKNPNAPGAAPGRHFGPMAQDLEKTAARGAVETNPQGQKQVDTGRLSLVNTAAISEQQKRIDALTNYIQNHSQPEAQVSQPPPEWKYIPSQPVTSDEDEKKNITGTVSGVASAASSGAQEAGSHKVADNAMPSPEDDGTKRRKAAAALASSMGGVYHPYMPADIASDYGIAKVSDIKAKTAIEPATIQAAMKQAPASFPTPIAPPGPPAEPVGTRERALAAGYAWLAAHGDAGAMHHEQPAEPMRADKEMAAARAMGEQIPQQPPTGYDAMRSSQYGLPSPEEADMQAIVNEVEARRKALGR